MLTFSGARASLKSLNIVSKDVSSIPAVSEVFFSIVTVRSPDAKAGLTGVLIPVCLNGRYVTKHLEKS